MAQDQLLRSHRYLAREINYSTDDQLFSPIFPFSLTANSMRVNKFRDYRNKSFGEKEIEQLEITH